MTDNANRVLTAFGTHFGGQPEVLVRAPGRVNLIGEHTDYNDGFALPMAISKGTIVAARVRNDNLFRVFADDLNESSAFAGDATLAPEPAQTSSNYLRGMVAALKQAGVPLTGADLAIGGDLPMGAGLSSSAALEMAAGLALAALAGADDINRTQLALAGQQAEHDFAGCQCGIMDQLVSAWGQAGAALLIDCRTLATRPVTLPGNAAVMIVHSGVSRGLVDGEYNLRRAQCAAAAAHYKVEALRDLDEVGLLAGQAGLDDTSFRRARHVVSESARVLATVTALEAGDYGTLGQLMAASHASMRDDFAITVPAIDQLVALLQDAIGTRGGARMTGGGFGGAVVAIMPDTVVQRVQDTLLATYRTPDGKPPFVMIEQPSAGAALIGREHWPV